MFFPEKYEKITSSLEKQIIVTIFLDNKDLFRHKEKFFVLHPHPYRRSHYLMTGKQEGSEGMKNEFPQNYIK